MKGGLFFSSWLFGTRLGILVFDHERASITVSTSEREASASAACKIDNPQGLRDFALKCMAAAEVMENAGSEAP